MIAELFPELKELDNEQKLILARELCDEAVAEEVETLPEEAVELIGDRVAQYMKNPASGISWDDLKKQALKDA